MVVTINIPISFILVLIGITIEQRTQKFRRLPDILCDGNSGFAARAATLRWCSRSTNTVNRDPQLACSSIPGTPSFIPPDDLRSLTASHL